MGVSDVLLDLQHPNEGSLRLFIRNQRVVVRLHWPFDASRDEFVTVKEDFALDEWRRALDGVADGSRPDGFTLVNSEGGILTLTKRGTAAFLEVGTKNAEPSLSKSIELRLDQWPAWLHAS